MAEATKTHKQSIGIQQPQRVGLKKWRDIIDSVVARLRRGAPRKYDHAAIARVAEGLILRGVDDKLDYFVERAWNECNQLGIKVPKNPLSTTLTDICAPIYNRERAKGELPANPG
jgi:hypothetical protein